MTLVELPAITEELLALKQERGVTFADLEKALGRDEVWIAAVFYRQASASLEEAKLILQTLGIAEEEEELFLSELTAFPSKGLGPTVPTDPLIYRFYEIMQVYGMPIKEVIHEKFGDGIMSAIDFTLDVEKVEDPKGDRVQVTMNGKFLPYKKW
jgi:cyanate lyase